jgi:hypothetical protein
MKGGISELYDKFSAFVKPDQRQCGPLRARRERPRRSATEQCDEFAPP